MARGVVLPVLEIGSVHVDLIESVLHSCILLLALGITALLNLLVVLPVSYRYRCITTLRREESHVVAAELLVVGSAKIVSNGNFLVKLV